MARRMYAIGLATLAAAVVVRAEMTTRLVALTGQGVPGTQSCIATLLREGNGPPVIDNQGNVVFRARLLGPGVTPGDDSAVLRADTDGLRLWLREGDAVPGGGVLADCAAWPATSPAVSGGRALIRNTSNGVTSLLAGDLDAQVILRTGAVAPGIDAPIAARPLLRSIESITLGGRGGTAWTAFVAGPGFRARRAIYSDHGGAVQLVAIEGGRVPGFPGETFTRVNPSVLLRSGGIAFGASTSASRQLVMSDAQGELAPVVWTGGRLPGGAILSRVHDLASTPSINADGHLACRARGASGVTAIWSNRAGIWAPVASPGDPIGRGSRVLGSLDSAPRPLINATGGIAFVASAGGESPAGRGVFISTSRGLSAIALDGDPIPGTPFTVASIEPWSLRMNSHGMIAFIGSIRGADARTSRALLATEGAEGPVRLIAAERRPFDLFRDGRDIRIVSAIGFGNATGSLAQGACLDGGSGALNDSGELAFLLRFSDESEGVFVAGHSPDLPAPPSCNPDFNCDGAPDQDDVACMIIAVAGDPSCSCRPDLDFNRDGVTDQSDVADLLLAVAGAPCP